MFMSSQHHVSNPRSASDERHYAVIVSVCLQSGQRGRPEGVQLALRHADTVTPFQPQGQDLIIETQWNIVPRLERLPTFRYVAARLLEVAAKTPRKCRIQTAHICVRTNWTRHRVQLTEDVVPEPIEFGPGVRSNKREICEHRG